MGIIILAAFVLLVVVGVPIAFCLGGAGVLGLLLSPQAAGMIDAVPQQVFNSLNSFPFLTIPLFIFAGTIMAEGGVAQRLMGVTEMTVGRGRGGLGIAVVVAAMFFHGISGSSTADTASIGKVTLPALRQQGYPLPFSTALLAAAGATATLVPPTIDLIIIGVVANMSIAGLFAAGVIPAIINAIGLIIVVVILSRAAWMGRNRAAHVAVDVRRLAREGGARPLHGGHHPRRHPVRRIHADRGLGRRRGLRADRVIVRLSRPQTRACCRRSSANRSRSAGWSCWSSPWARWWASR